MLGRCDGILLQGKALWSAWEQARFGCPVVESLDSAKDGFASTISGFGCRLLHVAPSVERRGSRVALLFTPVMNKRHTTLWDRRSKSAPPLGRRKNWRGNLQQMGWSIIWKVEG
ncbi:MAG TPA: hypothetical protein VFH31_19695 [Pyrinomonadaceae bacterium]|nr:hypothetical protein [Pyrinomonadaceae bacterium]